MTLTSITRFGIGDPVYFLNATHEITKGTVVKVDSRTIVYKDSYTGEQKDYTCTSYHVTTAGFPDTDVYNEEYLYSTPDEIVAMFNDQIEHGDFD